jgi:hypothetical protein
VRRLAGGLGLAVCLALAPGLRVSAHDPAVLDSHRPTPGIRLELVEVPRTVTSASSSRRYRLVAAGVPSGVTFGVWTREFTHAFHEVASGFRTDETGKLETVLDPGPYFRGAIWEVALVSQDRTITAFTRAIPRPIVAQDRGCEVTLELVSHRGQRFLASGRGFAPGDEVAVESRYAGLVHGKQIRALSNGVLPPDVISHAAPGGDRSARYSVTGRACAVTIEYEWGEPAFQRG